MRRPAIILLTVWLGLAGLGAGVALAQPSPTATPVAAATSTAKDPVAITVTSDKQAIEIGQSMRVQVEIANAPNAELKPVTPDKWEIKPFELQDSALAQLPDDENGRRCVRFTLRVACYEEGEQAFPAITLEYLKDGETKTATSQPFRVLVSKVPAAKEDKPGEIRDLKQPVEFPFPPIFIALGVVVLLVVVYALYKGVKWLRRPKPVKAEPPLPPYERARRDLDRIERERIWEEGRYEEYYDQLTLVLRQYLGWRFQVALLEKTTSETLDALKDKPGFDFDARKSLKTILEEGDLVKFARMQPGGEKIQAGLGQARELLSKLQPNILPGAEAKSA